jgi:hypothetical protein
LVALLLAALPQRSHYPLDPAYTNSSSTGSPALVVPDIACLAEDPFVSIASWGYCEKGSEMITYAGFGGLDIIGWVTAESGGSADSAGPARL